RRDCSRDFYLHDDDERAAAPSIQARHASALDCEHFAGLSPRRYHHGKARVSFVGLERGRANLGAEGRIGEGHVNTGYEIRSVALESRIVLHVDLDIEVAGRRSVRPGHSLAGNTQPLSRVDSRRKGDVHFACAFDAAVPGARYARLFDDAANTSAAPA